VTDFQIHTIDSAPAESKILLTGLQGAFGFIPNLAAVIANSPKLLGAFSAVFQQVHTSSLNEQEIQIVLLTDAVVNASPYAVAMHSALARGEGVDAETVEAIRAGQIPGDGRFAALSTLARTLIEKRGHLSEEEYSHFLSCGYRGEQVLEVIAIVAASTMTNYVGTIAAPPLENRFQQYAWKG
jgi:AhpD family alkylhydroperoxidase